MIRLNVAAPLDLTHRYLSGMIERGEGAIINVASVAAFQPLPWMATYVATKAFVLHFSEALWAEFGGVTVMALCPGPTDTNFFQAARMGSAPPKVLLQSPRDVVEAALGGISAGSSRRISGLTNKIMVFAARLVPRRLALSVAARLGSI